MTLAVCIASGLLVGDNPFSHDLIPFLFAISAMAKHK